jgi:carbon starvation protein CstA
VLGNITTHFLGTFAGNITIAGVIVLAITSGDTALRSTRMALAEMLHINQKPIVNRLAVCGVLLVVVALLLWWSNQSAKTFNMLWNYFSWGNQVLAVTTLLAGAVYLANKGWLRLIALVPGAFMLFIVACYILWISPDHGGPVGMGLDLPVATICAGVIAAIAAVAVWIHGDKLNRK